MRWCSGISYRRLVCLVAMMVMVMRVAALDLTGIVRDSVSYEPIPFATVAIDGTTTGVICGDHGGFNLHTSQASAKLRISAMGYASRVVNVAEGQTIVIVDLVQQSTVLDEVVVKQGKEKYSKKNNPAVDLARRLIATKHDNDPLRRHESSAYTTFEQMMLGFNDIDSTGNNNFLIKKFDFLKDYTLVSQVTGKRVLPLLAKQQHCTDYYRRSPRSHRRVVDAVKQAGLDDSFDAASMKRFMSDILREIDIFEANDVTLLTNRFVSPLSSLGISFYKYYLGDTIMIDGEPCVDLSFVPFNTESFGFVGTMWVSVAPDSSLFIHRVSMGVPRHINLNYVERVHMEQVYKRDAAGCRFKVEDVLEAEFRILRGTPGLFARRQSVYKPAAVDTLVFAKPDEEIVLTDADTRTEEYWTRVLPDHSEDLQARVKEMVTRLRSKRLFFWTERVVLALAKGWVGTKRTGSKVDIGPLNTFISGNSLEGMRLRIGAATNTNLSRRWFARAYLAFGTRDKKLKYSGQVEYSFVDKSRYETEFPVRSLKLLHSYDVERLGQNYMYTNPDNVFLALKRQKDNKLAYLRQTLLEFKWENRHNLAFTFNVQHNRHEASKLLPYVNNDGTQRNHYNETGFQLKLRWAPGEKFFQTRSQRIPINMDAPVLTFSHTWMPGGAFGNLHEVNKTEIGLQHRLWFSAWGYTDVIVKGGIVWSKVAYPDLFMPPANLSYTIQPESFALMNAMEFVGDRYVSADVTYWLNGWLLNRVPLLKKLKLREVVSCRLWWGTLTSKNDPARSGDLFNFPEGAICRSLRGDKPYIEMSVGLDNILTILRVDYVWRVTHRHVPGTDRRGVRIALHFSF